MRFPLILPALLGVVPILASGAALPEAAQRHFAVAGQEPAHGPPTQPERAVVLAGGFIPLRESAGVDAPEVARLGDGALVILLGDDEILDGEYWLRVAAGIDEGWLPQGVLALWMGSSPAGDAELFEGIDPLSPDDRVFVVVRSEERAFVRVETGSQEVLFAESLEYHALGRWDEDAGFWRVRVHDTFGGDVLMEGTYYCVLEWSGDVLTYDEVTGRDDEGFLVTEERTFEAPLRGSPEC